MRIVGGRYGILGVRIECHTVVVDEEAKPEHCSKAMIVNPAYAGVFFVGYGDDDKSAARDLFGKVKAADIEARKRSPNNSARAAHKRKTARAPTTATLEVHDTTTPHLVLCVSDVLTKNDRHGRGSHGTFEKPMAKAFKAAVAAAAQRRGFVPPIKHPAIKSGPHKRDASTTYGERTIRDGLWSLEVLSIWPSQRHLDPAIELANGDADAPLSMVRDAMQRAGIIDDDMRIVADRTHAIYRKDERRTIARLTRLDASAAHRRLDEIASLLAAESNTPVARSVPSLSCGNCGCVISKSEATLSGWCDFCRLNPP